MCSQKEKGTENQRVASSDHARMAIKASRPSKILYILFRFALFLCPCPRNDDASAQSSAEADEVVPLDPPATNSKDPFFLQWRNPWYFKPLLANQGTGRTKKTRL